MESQKAPREQDYRPKLFGKRLTGHQLNLIFCMYKEYKYKRRPLSRYELCPLIGEKWRHTAPPLSNLITLLDKFDDPEDPITKKRLSDPRLWEEVNRLYHTVIRDERSAIGDASNRLKGQ